MNKLPKKWFIHIKKRRDQPFKHETEFLKKILSFQIFNGVSLKVFPVCLHFFNLFSSLTLLNKCCQTHQKATDSFIKSLCW